MTEHQGSGIARGKAGAGWLKIRRNVFQVSQTAANGKPFACVHCFAPSGDCLAVDPVAKGRAIDVRSRGGGRGVLILVEAVEVDVDDQDGLDIEQPALEIAYHSNGEDQQSGSDEAGFSRKQKTC
jgi:hypothetical protein